MMVTAEMVQQALANHRRPPRTPGARLLQAIQHAKKKGRIMGPALNGISSTAKQISVGALADTEIMKCPRTKL